MRLLKSESKNATSLYVIKDFKEGDKRSTKVVEKLGTLKELAEKLNGKDPIEWAEEYIAELNQNETESMKEIIVKYSPNKYIPKDEQRSFNGGYLFLQKIYHELKLDNICCQIEKDYKFTFPLQTILSRLLFARILFPGSKLATFDVAKKFIEQPTFELQHIYRALEVIAKESEAIQATLYRHSQKVCKRNSRILFYDCTNFFFEIEQADGLKQYGVSKEHRPNPIVQMGLFMDGDGLPLAFSVQEGNTNEQITLKPFEKRIIKDFELSRIVVCTDAGLASTANRKFNNIANRSFITTQSMKKLKKHLRDWALSPSGWSFDGLDKTCNISELMEADFEKKENEKMKHSFMERIFYKERWIKEDGLEQKLIITYSLKYALYQKQIRNRQVERATKKIASGASKVEKKNQNDYHRFIARESCTKDGEVADKTLYHINQEVIDAESMFDGFYAVCTNLEDHPSEIAKINKGRWEIEESFRIMKSQFKSRPVYLSRDDRIKAHFTTCFISLLIYRLLEKKLEKKYTCEEIIDGLKDMNFYKIKGEGYIPTYTRTDFTDDLHEIFGFRTDYQIVDTKRLKEILKISKS
ncbi:MAG: IS1634 family transposase [Streptococcaceae bacterium]|jgi:transposase|nr:IS1634 family transposase [Streptococcaceae bacterium]